MPALDRYHLAVRAALIKEGWTITNDPLTLPLGNETLPANFGAERLIAAEKGTEKMAAAIKTFGRPSPIADLEQAVGQFIVYETVLQQVDPERVLYLAIPDDAYDTIFAERIGQLMLQTRVHHAFSFSPDTQEVTQWIP